MAKILVLLVVKVLKTYTSYDATFHPQPKTGISDINRLAEDGSRDICMASIQDSCQFIMINRSKHNRDSNFTIITVS